MKLKKLILLLFVSLAISLASCKSHDDKDVQIKTDIEKILVPGVTVEVDRGVAKISGKFENEETHMQVLQSARNVKNVKNVLDNAITQAQPTITPDNMLEEKVERVLVEYPLVTASVNDGMITLNGTIEREALPKLMQELNELQPKKVENLLKIN